MRVILAVALLVYVATALIVNSMIVNAATYDVALISQVIVAQLQTFSEFVTALGLSLFALRYYVSRLPDPDVVSKRRLLACVGIAALAFMVLLPAQQRAMKGLIWLAPEGMRRDALVLSVTNYGVLTGDVGIPQLAISREDIRTPPVQTLFPLLNPVLLFSDGYEAAREDVEPIGRIILNNDLARNHEIVGAGFNGAMEASCLALQKLYTDYSRASDETARDFNRSSDKQAVRQQWFGKVDRLFEEGADIVPQLGEDAFISHPVVQAKIRNTVETNLRAVPVPDVLKVLGSTDELAEYTRSHMAARVTNPCATTWNSFIAAGHKDMLVEDLVGYYSRLVREDYQRLGRSGDLSRFGEGVMLFAFAPAIGVAMTWFVASLQFLVAFSLLTRRFLVLPRPAHLAMVAVVSGAILIMPIALRSAAEQTRPGLEERFEIMRDLWGPWGTPLAATLRSLIRAEERVYPVGKAVRCATPLRAFDMFGEDCRGGPEPVEARAGSTYRSFS
ncbi:hypothetical protein [Rhodovulum marinum]|uniref:Uncharacterized protein n=1 Tax=Rhodovulum marinum TaxID=320662 RepID=A0A4R2PV71_9RHOB|nr:hypothetical protein [Rhodovulum marinum]TCP38075.1 hypothetical protein EV662_12219 [Rhodovulum marinum]